MFIRAFAVATLVLLGLAWTQPALARPSRASAHVVAVPSSGHPGDPIYVSGSGFPARHQVFILQLCPGIASPSLRSSRLPAVRTDATGRFVAFRVSAATPGTSHAVTCRITAGAKNASQPPSPGVRYRLLPRTQRLPYCSTHICLHVVASLVRLRNGTQGVVVVTGWPGATAQVAITGPGVRTIVRSTRLNWHGVGSVRARVSLGLIRGIKRQATVVARFGRISGTATEGFQVFPGGH